MVPGGIETVTVSSKDPNGAYSECNAASDNPGIASVALSDSVIQITGINFGTANVTITNAAGQSCILPVQVYDQFTYDTGELLIAYTSDFYAGPKSRTTYWSSWKPIAPNGFYTLGYYAKTDTAYPSDAMVVVKAKPGSDAIALSTSYAAVKTVFIDVNYGSLTSWRPIAPQGYVAMGMLLTRGSPAPTPTEQVACIREDLTIAAALDSAILYLPGDAYIWPISQPLADAHANLYLVPNGTFIFVDDGLSNPESDPSVKILNVQLPTLPEAPDQNIIPTLTSLDPPVEVTQPMLGRCLLAPFSVITDAVHDIAWKLDNSPTYVVQRETYYKLMYFNYNQTSELQTNSYTIISGITTTESETFRASVGISIGAEVGVALSSIAVAKVTASVSYELGYERMTGISELQQREVTTSINTPPGKAAALWQKFTRFTIHRHLPFGLETVDSKEVGIDSYVTDEYPD